MQCPYCKHECKPNAAYCPKCLTSLLEPDGAESKNSTMLNMLKNDWKIFIVIVILVLGIPALLSYNTSKKDETVIGQVKLLLSEGYADNADLSEVKWGKVSDAKLLIMKLSDNSSVRKEADSLMMEIANRETGMAVVDAQKIIDNEDSAGLDIEKAKKIKENFTYVQPANRYYEAAKDVLPEFSRMLDVSLLTRAKQELAENKITEARNDLADISSLSPYAYEAKLVNEKLWVAELAIKKAEEIRKRTEYAKNIAERLTTKTKMNILVTIAGENSDQLTVKYKTLSYAELKKYVDEDKMITIVQDLGFKRVMFDKEDGESWEIKFK